MTAVHSTTGTSSALPLAGLRVLDIATMAAAPWAAAYLAELGADVIKVEHPNGGDHQRHWGTRRHDTALFWKSMGRNKRCVTLNLNTPAGAALFLRLAADVDVVVENFRPGTLERWGIGYKVLCARNPGVILLRVTGFGQTGPYRQRPGFGTLAESLTGFASLNGASDGPPALPNMPLADGLAGVTGAFAVMVALYWRDARGGTGQVIDLSLVEPLLRLVEPALLDFDQLGIVRARVGNRSEHVAPRNAYRCGDGRWVSISASAPSIFERLMRAIGQPGLIADPRFCTNEQRLAHVEELDAVIGAWIGTRSCEEVLRALQAAEVAIAPIYTTRDVFADEHFRARGSFAELADPELGRIALVNVVPRFSATPGYVRHTGRALGADNEEIYGALGLSRSQQAELAREGVI